MELLEGSHAIAKTIKNIKPAVVSAYPITPQTHIVEDLAKFKADGQADYEYVRAESEFAAASIVEGASATGVRTYSATSSQGLLLMIEVIYNIAGMRLPVVLTCANRGVSAPITIWNDHQDAMTMRDAGWLMFFAENHQEAVDQHIMAYKLAESLKIPAVVNIDGFIITHTYESVEIPTTEIIKKYLPDYKPKKGEFLDPTNPKTFGALAAPEYYLEIRQKLHEDLINALELINKEFIAYHKIVKPQFPISPLRLVEGEASNFQFQNGLVEYIGPNNPEVLLIAMGSIVGTIREAIKDNKNVGILKIKTYRPFPSEEILKHISKAKYVAVIEKAISLGYEGPLVSDIKASAQGKIKTKLVDYIVGLGGRDIRENLIKEIIKDVKQTKESSKFMG